MSNKNQQVSSHLPRSVKRLSELHFLYVLAIGVQIVVYDLWNVLTPEVILWRWSMALLLLLIVAGAWQAAHDTGKKVKFYQYLVYVLIAADVLIATFNIYTQRGMASRAVIMYVIPIFAAATLRSKKAVFSVAAISVLSYVTASVIYFMQTFSEGYKAELIGEIGFYSAILVLIASFLAKKEQDQ